MRALRARLGPGMIRSRRFRPPLWATLLTAGGATLFAGLGTWQLQRGQDKAQARAELAVGPAAAETLSQRTREAGELELRPAMASGAYLAGRTLLLDGQAHEGRPGLHVLSPLRLADGVLAIVDRGWIPLAAAPAAPPPGVVQVRGLWRSLPEPGLRLAGTANCPARKTFPLTVLYPTRADLACILGEPVLPGLLLLDPAEPGGFVRAWSVPGLPPARHYGYAAQWFALAGTAVVLYVVLNLRRPPA